MRVRELKCKGVTKSFGGVCALDEVSFTFPLSGITAIIGPNGAGKTTLIDVMTGFLKPDDGECFVNGRAVSKMKASDLVDLGIARTFQDLRLIRQLTVEDNLMLAFPNQIGESPTSSLLGIGKSQQNKNKEEAERILKFIGLEAKREKIAGNLSYGQQKLLTIGCCLATQADLLVFDEPVSGINPKMISKIHNLLKEVSKKERAILFIEHNIESVRKISNKVIVMDNGSIILNGSTKDVLEHSKTMEVYLDAKK